VLRRQTDGQEVDMDALVAAIADRRGGAEPSPRLFCRRQRDERSLAAVFLST
jgi:nitric oxide reductase NorD protein